MATIHQFPKGPSQTFWNKNIKRPAGRFLKAINTPEIKTAVGAYAAGVALGWNVIPLWEAGFVTNGVVEVLAGNFAIRKLSNQTDVLSSVGIVTGMALRALGSQASETHKEMLQAALIVGYTAWGASTLLRTVDKKFPDHNFVRLSL